MLKKELVEELNKAVADVVDFDDIYSNDNVANMEVKAKEQVIANHPELTEEEKEEVMDADSTTDFIDVANYLLSNGYISNDSCPHTYIKLEHVKHKAIEFWKSYEPRTINDLSHTPVDDFHKFIKNDVGSEYYHDCYKKVLKDNYSVCYDILDEAMPDVSYKKVVFYEINYQLEKEVDDAKIDELLNNVYDEVDYVGIANDLEHYYLSVRLSRSHRDVLELLNNEKHIAVYVDTCEVLSEEEKEAEL